jgi:hypothetical protein
MTKTFLESGLLRETEGHYELVRPLPVLAIPATLQDSFNTLARFHATIGQKQDEFGPERR